VDYKTRRYKEGLSGKKPGAFYLDEEGHRAQASGYRDHLKNEDLAEKLDEMAGAGYFGGAGGGGESYSGSYVDHTPLSLGQRIFWGGLGAVLLVPLWIYLISIAINLAQNQHHDIVKVALPGLAILIAGLIMSLPGYACMYFAFNGLGDETD